MKHLKLLFGGGLVVVACVWCYLAGQEDRIARAEADLLRAQAAEAQERIRLYDAAAVAQAQREQAQRPPHRDDRPRLLGPAGLPVDVIRQPGLPPVTPDVTPRTALSLRATERSPRASGDTARNTGLRP